MGNKSKEELEDYMDLIQDMGAVLIKRWGPWMILKKKGDFELYTDASSKIKYYSKIRNMFLGLLILEIVSLINIFHGLTVVGYINNILSITGILLILAVIVAFFTQIVKCMYKIEKLKKE